MWQRRRRPDDADRQFWLERFTLEEIRELAIGIFGDQHPGVETTGRKWPQTRMVVPLGTDVHRPDQLEPRREEGVPGRVGHRDHAVLERLPQRFEHRAREFGELVEEEDAAMPERAGMSLEERRRVRAFRSGDIPRTHARPDLPRTATDPAAVNDRH
jgi:hypothetical protein